MYQSSIYTRPVIRHITIHPVHYSIRDTGLTVRFSHDISGEKNEMKILLPKNGAFIFLFFINVIFLLNKKTLLFNVLNNQQQLQTFVKGQSKI